MTLFKVYTDGSFRKEEGRWAFVIVSNDSIESEGWGKTPAKFLPQRQIGGELIAVGKAIEWAKQNNCKIKIYHDYTGVYKWVADAFGEKPWQAKNELTQRYRKFVLDNIDYVDSFEWVKGHSGDKWNDYVDQLMWNEE